MPKDDKDQTPSPGAPPPETVGMRGLTQAERAFADTAFSGKDMGYGEVRLCNGAGGNPAAMMAFANGNPAITLNRTIYFKGRFRDDFSTGDLRDRLLLLHELTHIWQYRAVGFTRFMARYALELARCGFNAHKLYLFADDARFDDSTLEAQAEMVAHYKKAELTGNAESKRKLAASLAGTGFYRL
jgi:hypothetical protein